MVAMAQRVEVVAVNQGTGEVTRKSTAADGEDLYIAIFAYGLPRDIVRTNAEMRSSIYSGETYAGAVTIDYENPANGYIGAYGVTQRHHTTKGLDRAISDGTNGYNVNHLVSFAYLVAPYNVNANGEVDTSSTVELDWFTASGWSDAVVATPASMSGTLNSDGIGTGVGASTLSDDPSGCAAYKGVGGEDPEGTWRLPTQREAQVMFTIIDQAIELNAAHSVGGAIVAGDYWTSTEFIEGTSWKAFANSSISGNMFHDENNTSTLNFARCVRDIYFKVNDVTVTRD